MRYSATIKFTSPENVIPIKECTCFAEIEGVKLKVTLIPESSGNPSIFIENVDKNHVSDKNIVELMMIYLSRKFKARLELLNIRSVL